MINPNIKNISEPPIPLAISWSNEYDGRYGELIDMDVTLSNFGMQDASGVTAQLTSSNPNITIVDDNDSWWTILASASERVSNAFSVSIANDFADLEIIN